MKTPVHVSRQELHRQAGREILLSFWKVHILHHAAEHPVVGQWMMKELQEHGYEVNPGTLYPVLKRMETRGWIRNQAHMAKGRRARREYILTADGRRVLRLVREFLNELAGEVTPGRASTIRTSNSRSPRRR